VPPAANGESPDALIRRADGMRDARHWAEAAALYRQALQAAPRRAAIWVQLGHACKESGDLAGAEAAYRQSLELAPNMADTHLQLGHVLKLQGKRPAAVAAYARALRVDRSFTPALHELIALGESWTAEQESGLGAHMLAGMLQAVSELRGSLARLERALPDVAALNGIPPARYDLFRTCYHLPAPPPGGAAAAWSVLVLHTPGRGLLPALLRGLAGLDRPPVGVTLVTDDPAAEAVLQQSSSGGLRCPVERVGGEAPPVLPGCEWVLVADATVTPAPAALGWLDWAAAQVAAAAIYTDEDHVVPGSDGAAIPERPVLKAAYDPEAEVPTYRHGFVALRATAAGGLLAEAWGSADRIGAVVDAAARSGGVAHLPRILGSRRAELPALPRSARATGTAAMGSAPAATAVGDGTANPVMAAADAPRIGVVIPTRNGALLQPCLDRLRSTAAEPASLDIVVLDNGSDDAATLALLDALAGSGAARVVRDASLFNWSRLSNAGAAACDAPLLLFMNDDVELSTRGWDAMLRQHLRRPEIGAVGARLLYPDGGVQHGGMVFGPGRRAEHEGVAPVGVAPDIAARWVTRRRVAAVTGAFLACRRAEFAAVGGFDEGALPIWFNDVDFCLKLRRAGRLVLYAPEIVATHHESRTLAVHADDPGRKAIFDESLGVLRQRWGEALATDPGFNPHFARVGRPFEMLTEPSVTAVQEHLVRSAAENPWAVG
jgi:GT2 family glycosyltransferase/tetratricopeptide (TPR) repeat protein